MQLAERLWREGQHLFWVTHLWATFARRPYGMVPQDYHEKRRVARLLLKAAAVLDPQFAEPQEASEA